MLTIANAFSINMLEGDQFDLRIEKIDSAQVTDLLRSTEFRSVVGHTDTAAVMSSLLGVEIPANRTTYHLSSADTLIVGQYRGPRLAEGTMELPEGATITFYKVTLS